MPDGKQSREQKRNTFSATLAKTQLWKCNPFNFFPFFFLFIAYIINLKCFTITVSLPSTDTNFKQLLEIYILQIAILTILTTLWFQRFILLIFQNSIVIAIGAITKMLSLTLTVCLKMISAISVEKLKMRKKNDFKKSKERFAWD